MFDEFRLAFENKAAAHGFDGWELHGIRLKSLEVSLKVDEAPSLSRSEVFGIALRATQGPRSGFSFTERLDEAGAEFLAHAAAESLGSMGEGTPCEVFEPGATYPEVNNYDPHLSDEEYVTSVAMNANRCVCALEPSMRQSQSSKVKVDEKRVYVANSRGVDLAHQFNYATLELDPTASDRHKMRESHVFVSMNSNGVPDIEALCAQGVETAKDYLTAVAPDSGKYGIVFRNSVAAHLIQGFAIFFCGEQVRKRVSLVHDKVGRRVASPALTVIDDPLLPQGIFSCPFDAQGVPTRTKTILEDGVLRGFMHNLNTAAACKTQSTGNAWRISHDQPLEAAPCNIYVKPGHYTESQLFEMLGDGIYVTRLVSTFHGAGVNAVSGDFSMPARGFKIEGGKKRGALELFTVSGNYYQLIRDVRACANDLFFAAPNMLIPGAPAEYGNYGSPAVLVDNISVSGK